MSESKKLAAEKAMDFIRSGMVLGLGTGSTVYFVLQNIAELLKSGELRNIIGIPSSKQTEDLAKEFGIPLTTLDENPVIDLTIDGADEVDPTLDLIKGGGGALWKEKIIAQASKKFIVVADDSKFSQQLGEKWHVPIETLQFAAASEKLFLESVGGEVEFRKSEDGSLYKTDEGNIIIDCNFGLIEDAYLLASKMEHRAGIIEHGLFLEIADVVIIASDSGIKVYNRR